MYASICKTIYRLPKSTPTAMVLEDRGRGGMGLTSLSVTYAQAVAQHMVAALNDEGSLGMITRALLQLQNDIIGSAIEAKQNRITARHTAHYHLARQMAVIKEAGIQIATPADHPSLGGNALAAAMSRMRYSRSDIGDTCTIPLAVYQPLLELGLKDFRDLLAGGRKIAFLSTQDLSKKYGKKVKPRHKIALNRLTKIVNSAHLHLDASQWRKWNTTSALDNTSRVLRNPEMFSELRSADARYVDCPDLDEHVDNALQRLQRWHQRRETRKQPKPVKQPRATTIVFRAARRKAEAEDERDSKERCTHEDRTQDTIHTDAANISRENTRPNQVCLKRNCKPKPKKRSQTQRTNPKLDEITAKLVEQRDQQTSYARHREETRRQYTALEDVSCQTVWQD